MNIEDVRRLFLNPEGRIGRAAFWLGWLSLLCVEAALRFALGVPFTPTPEDPFSVRLLSFLIETLLLIATTVIALAFMVDLGFRRGTHGDNQYGPDTLRSHT